MRTFVRVFAVSSVVAVALGGLVVPAVADDPKPVDAAVDDPFNSRLSVAVGATGRFSAGAFPGASGAATTNSFKLSYGWPSTGTSYTTVRIDGVNNIFGAGGLSQAPTDVDGNTNDSTWTSGAIRVKQRLQLVSNPDTGQVDTAAVSYTVTNTGATAHSVGVRMMVDTDVNNNDGAPFRVPGVGSVTTERSFVGTDVPAAFQVFSSLSDTTHIAGARFRGATTTTPDRVIIGTWPHLNSSPWDDTTNGSAVTADSAYAAYWDPFSLDANQSRTVTTYYGLSSVTADLSGNLHVGLSGPAALSVAGSDYTPNPFTVSATLSALANTSGVNAQLNLPAGLHTGDPTLVTVGDVTAGAADQQVSWQVTADPAPDGATLGYSVMVNADNASPITVNRSVSLPPLAPNGAVSDLTLTSSGGTLTAGGVATPTSGISADELTGSLNAVASAPLRGSPLRGSPLRGSPLRGSGVAGAPLRGSPLRGSPLRGSPLRGSLLASTPVPLSELPLTFPNSWSAILANTNLPIENATLSDVLSLDPATLAGLTLADIDWNHTPLRNVSLIAFLTAGVPISSLAPPPASLPPGVTDLSKSFLDYELTGMDFSDYYAAGVELAGRDLGSSPLGNVLLGDMWLANTPLGAVRAARLPSGWVSGSLNCPTCTTLADVQAASPDDAFTNTATLGALLRLTDPAGPLVPSVSFGELLPGLLPGDELPYDAISPQRIAALAPFDGSDFAGYEADFLLDCGTAPDVPAVTFTLPSGFRYEPGSATFKLAATDLTPSVAALRDHVTVKASVAGCTGINNLVKVTIKAEPGIVLGDAHASATLTYGGTSLPPAADDQAVKVVDNPTPVAAPGNGSTVFLGRISTPGEQDTYTLPALAAGTAVTLTLAHIPDGQDYDLSVFGPAAPDLRTVAEPLRGSPLRGSPLRGSGVDDTTADPSSDGTSAPPEPQSDVPITPPAGQSVWGVSDNRGSLDESVTTVVPDGSSGPVSIVVSGFNGSSSPNTYSLVASVVPPADPPPCISPAFTSTGEGGSVTALAAPTVPLPNGSPAKQTLILTDPKRLGNIYGAAPTNAMLTKLSSFAARSDVNGVIIPVETDSAVASAYASWDAAPCSPAAANAVVNAINAYVDRLRTNLTDFRYLVIAGGDLVVPMGRVRDHIALDNETSFANDEVYTDGTVKHDNQLSAALRGGYVLSDDVYGDFNPIPWLDTQAFVPDVAVGRLVETPQEIGTALDAYVASNGVRSPNSAYTAGYDFNSDGAQQVATSLAPRVPAGTAMTSINGTWTRSDAINGITTAAHGFVAVNAHYDAYRALPASEFTNGTQNDLLTTADLPASLSGGVLFTIGCHAGLNVADTFVASATEAARKADWSQAVTNRGGIYAANSGYGYGDSAGVAYSEKLMADFAANLDGSTTVGQALMFAKQSYLHLPLSAVDAKVMEEATFYGLPMYKVGATGQSAASVIPPMPGAGGSTNASGSPVSSSIASTGSTGRHYVLQSTGLGDFYTVQTGTATPEAPLALPGRPLEPLTSDAFAQRTDGLVAHGVHLDALRTHLTTSTPTFDPVYSQALPDSPTSSNEPNITNSFFPASVLGLVSKATKSGIKDVVTINAGRFRSAGPHGYQQLTDSLGYHLLYSNSSDVTPPTISTVNGLVTGSGGSHTATFTVASTGGAVAADVLYLVSGSTSATDWQSLSLTPDGSQAGLFSGSVSIGAATSVDQFVVQVTDASNNVATSTSKGQDFQATTAPRVGSPAITLSGAPSNGTYTGSQTVSISGDGPLTFRLDGATTDSDYAGPFQVSAAGDHTVSATDGHGNRSSLTFRIAAAPAVSTGPGPSITITSPTSGGVYTVGQSIPITATCTDAGGGALPCLATPGGGYADNTFGEHSVTVTAVAGDGSRSSRTVSYVVQYRFLGFLQPINDPALTTLPQSVFKISSTVPTKFQLVDVNGAPAPDALANAFVASCRLKLAYAVGATANVAVDESVYSDPPDSGACFRYDATARQFIYNFSSKAIGASPGSNVTLKATADTSAGRQVHAVVIVAK